jgi:hypothetical protein
MNISLKPGVSLKGLKTEILFGVLILAEILREMGLGLTITSGNDGTHSAGSKHYEGLAVDIRSRDKTKQQVIDAVAEFKRRADQQFDIVIESTHIHLEYDPH